MTKLTCNKRDTSIKMKKLRRENLVPAIVYGKNLDASVMVQISRKTLEDLKGIISNSSQIELDIDGEAYSTMIKAIDYVPMTRYIQHIDFQVLTTGEKIKTVVPITFINKEEIKQEGNVQEALNTLDYEVLPKDMLESLEVDLSGLTVGHDIKVRDLAISSDDRYHILTSPDTVVASLVSYQAVVLETEDTDQVVAEEVVE